jgi:hypothetical protein
MARVRSPNYPQFSLPEAISRIQKIHAAEQHLAAPREVLAKHLGYGGMNGKSSAALSALGKYGLLEDAPGDKLRVSQLALSILHPKDAREKAGAIQEAATRPPLFVEIANEWPDGTPSDQNLRSYLIRKNFAVDAIDRVIKSFRETVELVTQESVAYGDRVGDTPEPEAPPMIEQQDRRTAPVDPAKVAFVADHAFGDFDLTKVNQFSIVDQGSVIHVRGTVDRKGLDKLLKKLVAYKAVLDASADDDEDLEEQDDV